MTYTPRRWDRLTAESDPAFEAFAAYLDTGSLRDAYRQRSGKAQATAAPGAWTGWSTKYNWVSRRVLDSLPLGTVTIDTNGAITDDGMDTYTEEDCGTYNVTGSGGFFGRELRFSLVATSTTCLNLNFTAVLSR